jgi:AraC-like DNA-binding protein
VLAKPARFSTHDLSDAQRSARWEEWNRAALVGLTCHTPNGRGLRGAEITLELPSLTLGLVHAEPHRVSRSVQTVEDSPTDCVVFYAVLSGRTSFSDGNRSHGVAAGDVAVLDAGRPFARSFPTRFTELALKIPRQVLDTSAVGHCAAGAEFVRASGLTALRVQALGRHLAESIQPVPSVEVETISRVALDLVTDVTTSDGPGDLFALGQLLIEQNLGDPGLSATRLAAALDISLRQLTRLFADAHTTFPRYLTERRLLRATALLARPVRTPIAKIAATCGFSSAAYFSRVFRDHHGVPPGRFVPM